MAMAPDTEAMKSSGGKKGWPRVALLSLADKGGAADFARALAEHGTRIVASGGTARHLGEAGIQVTAVESWTGFSDLLGGRVKTLHPRVHAPILARRERAADMEELSRDGLEPIDLVAVSLYAFEQKAPGLDDPAAIEEIDIGGVALLRAAAKNHADVIVVHDPAQYPEVLAALERGVTSGERRRWAVSVFERTARYDAAIAADLVRREAAAVEGAPQEAAGALPERPTVHLRRIRGLRYGENPHQEAALYQREGWSSALQASREGKELSYNNLLDLEAAVRLVWEFAEPACVIVKHSEPCGAATAETASEAYAKAFAGDPLSAFGGVLALNRPLDRATADAMGGQFVECVAAPELTADAMRVFETRKNVRVLRVGAEDMAAGPEDVRFVGPFALVQRDRGDAAPPWRVVTRSAPDEEAVRALRFAWRVAAAARSNAIAVARGEQLVGLGSGQTSRVDAVDLALTKARRAGHDVKGAALASDGFFPFADNIEHAAAAGITAIVQPGGSRRDDEVVAACDRLGVAMMLTGRRAFKH